MNDIIFFDVRRLAEKHGVKIKQFLPGTSNCRRFGENCFEIESTPEPRKEYTTKHTFDPNMLMT